MKYSDISKSERNMDIAHEVASDLASALRGLEALLYINDMENVIPSKLHARVLDSLNTHILSIMSIREFLA